MKHEEQQTFLLTPCALPKHTECYHDQPNYQNNLEGTAKFLENQRFITSCTCSEISKLNCDPWFSTADYNKFIN